MSERHHFDRPTTWFNQAIRSTLSMFPTHEINQQTVEDLRDNSLRIYGSLVLHVSALDVIRSNCDWSLSSKPCPPEVLSGEVTFDNTGNNFQAHYFADAPAMRIPAAHQREAALLSAADHFVGHLYQHFAGYEDCGEEAAILWQNHAARERYRQGDTRFRHKPLINAIGYKFHKNIPLSVHIPERSQLRLTRRQY